MLRGQDRPGEPAPSSLSVRVSAHHHGLVKVLRLAGDLDVTNADQLRTVIGQALASPPQMR